MASPIARNFMLVLTAEHAGNGLDWLENKTKLLGENLENYGIIYHDLDTTNLHYHVALKTKQPIRLSAIAKAYEQPDNLVKIWRRDEGNMWAYLTHQTKKAKAEKVDYTPYLDDLNKTRFDSEQTKQKCVYDIAKSEKGEKAIIEKLCHKILDGEITKKDVLAPELIWIYFKNKTKINDAIQIRTESLRLYAPKCQTTLITGASGTGKTQYAVELAKQQYPTSWAMASSGNDALQDYTGEKCIIFDDWRPDDYKLQDLLALLDPNYRQRTHKSRYYNKPLATALIIITTNLDMDAIIAHYTGFNNTEDPKQIRRRIQTVITMQTDFTAIIEKYNEQLDGWEQPA